MEKRKVYVLCRGDLKKISSSYPAVQGSHALAQLYEEKKTGNWANHYLLFVEVKNEDALYKWSRKMDEEGISYSAFREPDQGMELTALAVRHDGKFFKRLQIL